MKKIEFLDALRSGLADLPYAEREAYISYYAEMMDDMAEDGMSEEEVTASIGAPEDIAAQIIGEYRSSSVEEKQRVSEGGEAKSACGEPVRTEYVNPKKKFSVMTVILLILGAPVWLPLLFAGVIVLLSVYIVLWSLVVSLYAVVLGFGLGGIALVLGGGVVAIMGQGMLAVLFEGAGLVLIGLALLLVFVSNLTAKCAWFLTKLPFRGFSRKEKRI